MKRILVIVLMLSVLVPLRAQDLKLTDIEETWLNAEGPIPVKVTGKKPGIGDFATAFSKKYRDNVLVGKLYNYLTADFVDEEVADFDLDSRSGFVSIHLVSDATVQAEMCYWNLPDGRQRIGVKLFNFYELPRPLLMFYDYDSKDGRMMPLHPTPVDCLPDFARCDFHLPKTGKDIRLYPEYEVEGEAWLRYDGLNGFVFDGPDSIEMEFSMAPGKAIVDCYITPGGSWANVRKGPSATSSVVARISPEGAYTLIVETPKAGWWHILDDRIYPAEAEDDADVLFLGGGQPCWIHHSVVCLDFVYSGGDVKLYEEPSRKARVVATVSPGSEGVVHPLDVNSDGGWVKISCGDLIGWVRVETLCSNPLTTCN
ncbi:MAG: hypothetical protein IJ636_00965 [Bacteroidales bacterium]|nr:hypothetical protein [Bacteroidales bacterium]